MVAVAVDHYSKNINSDRGDLGAILRAAWRFLGGLWESPKRVPGLGANLVFHWKSLSDSFQASWGRLFGSLILDCAWRAEWPLNCAIRASDLDLESFACYPSVYVLSMGMRWLNYSAIRYLLGVYLLRGSNWRGCFCYLCGAFGGEGLKDAYKNS